MLQAVSGRGAKCNVGAQCDVGGRRASLNLNFSADNQTVSLVMFQGASGLQTGGLRASHNLNFLADNQTVCLVMFQVLSGTEQVGCGRVLT